MVRKLFLTPPNIPASDIDRCLEIPASQEWLAVFNQAILQMINPYNYEQRNDSDLTPQEAADKAYEIYVRYLLGDCVDCEKVVLCVPDIAAEMESTGLINPNTADVNETGIMDRRFPPVDRSNPIIELDPACSLDELWAGILEFVERLDQYSLDFLELLVAETDAVQRIAEIVALVPLFGDIIGESLNLLASEAENLKNAYEAYQTPAVREEIACDLFQMTCALCRYPTWDEVIAYYETLSILDEGDYAEIAIQAIFDALIGTSGLANLTVWYTTNIVQLYVRYLGGSWIQQVTGRNFLPIWLQLGEDSPSSDWQLLCGDCGTNEDVFDFTASDQGWQAITVTGESGPRGQYMAATGWESAYVTQDPPGTAENEVVHIYYTYPSDLDINEVEITFDFTQGDPGISPDTDLRLYAQPNSGGASEIVSQDTNTGTDIIFQASFTQASSREVQIKITASFDATQPVITQGSVLVKECRVRYT